MMFETIEAGDEIAQLRARVAELEEEAARLRQLADTDTLTPLRNRRAFVRALERAIGLVARHGTPAALLFIDVDALKRINDGHGHGMGDRALLHVAYLLQERVRATDIVARIGGDEFGLLLDHLGEEAAREKALALCEAVADAPLEGRIEIGLSIGIAALRPDDTPASALARADGDMYAVKRRK